MGGFRSSYCWQAHRTVCLAEGRVVEESPGVLSSEKNAYSYNLYGFGFCLFEKLTTSWSYFNVIFACIPSVFVSKPIQKLFRN